MATNTTSEALVIRDQAGTHYLLTPEALAEARATAEQEAALRQGGDTAGFGIKLPDFQGRQSFQVVGMVALPLPAQSFEPNRQNLIPCV